MKNFYDGLQRLIEHYCCGYQSKDWLDGENGVGGLKMGAVRGKITCTVVHFPVWQSDEQRRDPGPNYYEQADLADYGWIWNKRMWRFEYKV